jgi:outer membrane lipoprotein-sorting protein
MKVMNKPMTMKMKMYFKSPGLMRQEITTEGGNTATAPVTSQTTTAPAAQRAFSIFDISNKKGVVLIPAQKKAIVYDLKNVPAGALDRPEQQNFLDTLKKAVAGEHEDLGEKTIDGRKLKGYRCKSALTKTMDIWVDATTGRPVLVEQTLPEGMGKSTMTDFVLNPKLDDSLFDTGVPEGYTVENQTLDFDVKEDQLIKGLSLFAKYCGGVFPKGLMPTPEFIGQMEKAKASMKTKPSMEEGKEFGLLLQKMMMFQIRTTQAGGEFVYAGGGVKLGDKATPILWYKAKAAKTYRVIYGDLHAEDAETAPKPPASQPATKPR